MRQQRSSPVLTDDATDLLVDHLGRTGRLLVRARGSSMWPTVRADDVLEVSPVDRVAPGDIVVARRAGHLWAHRVRRVDEDGEQLTLRGDARFRSDPRFQRADLLGRVDGLRRHGGPGRPPSRLAPTIWPIPGVAVAAARAIRRWWPSTR